MAYGATSRHVYAVVDDDENKRKLFVKAKNNLARHDQPALAYGFGTREVGLDPKTNAAIWAPHIIWFPEHVDVTAAEAMTAANQNKGTRAIDNAKTFLSDMLANGPMAKRDIDEAAEANCISAATLRRAKDDLKIVTEKDRSQNGGWTWRMPTSRPRERYS